MCIIPDYILIFLWKSSLYHYEESHQCSNFSFTFKGYFPDYSEIWDRKLKFANSGKHLKQIQT